MAIKKDKKTVSKGVRLPQWLADDLIEEADRRGDDFSSLTRKILTEFMRPGSVKL